MGHPPYDTENNLTSIADALGRTTSFSYDAFGRVVQTAFPSSYAEAYAYDAIGNLTSKTDRKGQTIQYVYDALNRLTRKRYPDSTEVDYVYDLVGKVLSVNDPSGTYAFAYDNMGRLIGTTTQYSFLLGRNLTTSYAYDAASNRVSATEPDASTNSYVYDSLNRLTDLTSSWAGHFGFGYDVLSRRTSLNRPNGISTSYSYDSLSRLLNVLHQAGGVTIDGATYTLDNAGNRSSKQNLMNGVTENYTYDLIYQLTQVQQGGSATESYAYDAVGNRLSSLGLSPYQFNSSNQLTSTPNATFTYDNNGNTASKTDSNGVTGYSWDYENRLTLVTLPGSGGTVTFKHDPFGRRIQKSGPAGTINYLYDGANVVTDLDSSGAVIASYAQGSGIDEPLASISSAGTAFFEADGLGSITSLSGMAGITDTYTYKAFGVTSATGTNPNRFRYTGREWDSETGLYYYRARYYDPQIGRFISEDPTQFSEGPNFYIYVDNNAVVDVDPFGLAKCTYSISSGRLNCVPDDPRHKPVDISVASGNNGGGMQCKDNPKCTRYPNRGPIPQGNWQWTGDATSKPNGRVLEPLPGTDTFGRDLFRTHSCKNAFGPSIRSPFCSEGCITGSPADIKRLNRLLDAEPGSKLHVTD